ncbi:hypothetical protein DPMN_153830 [Dreissena polymorpha]|uniref:Uncharacterized protein n=1 Tax=Dreissena polymorpha TaxID=45954 RepID=A0A9D4FK13_DREPO|nr:hypothetical protein DPMN_153830 [Dreissena polymorpha]
MAQMRKGGRFFQAENHFYMRSKCHPDYAKTGSSSEVISLCEIRTENKLEIHVPVLDTIANVTYANKYCAQCNFVTDTDGAFPGKGNNLVYWDSDLQCTDANEASSILAASNQGFIKAILQTKTCNVLFKPKPVYVVHTSACPGFEIDKCNATGNMTTYDPWLEKACGAYTSTFNETFKNVFCFLCNTVYTFRIDLNVCLLTWEKGTNMFPEFSSLLAFTPDKRKPPTSQPTGCSSEQVFDEHEEICRDIFCRFPKRFNGSECVNAVDTLDGVSYKLYLKFTPQTPLSNGRLEEFVVLLENKITEMLQIWELYNAVYSFGILYNLNKSIIAPSVLSTAHTLPHDKLTTFLSTMSTPLPSTAPQPSRMPGLVPTIRDNERTSTEAAPSESIEYFLVMIEMNLNHEHSYPEYSVTLLDKALEFDKTSMVIASKSSRFNVTFNVEFVDFSISDYSYEFEIKMFDPVSGILLSKALTLFNPPSVKATNTSTVLTARFKCQLVVINITEINSIENNAFRLKTAQLLIVNTLITKKIG